MSTTDILFPMPEPRRNADDMGMPPPSPRPTPETKVLFYDDTRPTPETDAFMRSDNINPMKLLKLARRLEQQRDEAREANKVFADKCRQELIDLRAERDEWKDQFHAAMDNVRGMETYIERLRDRNKQSPEYLSILEAMLTVKAERDQLNEEIADLRADKARLILRLRHNPMKEAKP